MDKRQKEEDRRWWVVQPMFWITRAREKQKSIGARVAGGNENQSRGAPDVDV